MKSRVTARLVKREETSDNRRPSGREGRGRKGGRVGDRKRGRENAGEEEGVRYSIRKNVKQGHIHGERERGTETVCV